MKKGQSPLRILAWPAFKSRYKNPYSWLLYTAMESSDTRVFDFSMKDLFFHSYDILHGHWPEVYLSKRRTLDALLGSAYRLSMYFIAKMRGAKVVWTVHNTLPHNLYHPNLQKLFYFLLLKVIDGYICLSKPSYEAAIKSHPGLLKIPNLVQKFGHGHYRDVYENIISREDARKKMGIDDKKFVILFLGTITPYKNIISLCACFTQIQDNNLQLIIAGKPTSEEVKNDLKEMTKSDHRIELVFEFIPDEELQIYYNSSDLVTLPFLNMTNSGSALCALSFNSPILTPHTGSMQELQNLFGHKWVKTYEGKFTLDILCNAIDDAQSEQQNNERLDMSILDWQKIAAETRKFYQQISSK